MNRYSAIKDMYYGRRGDGQLIKPTKEYHEQFSKLNDISEKLKDKLNGDGEGLELLEAFFGHPQVWRLKPLPNIIARVFPLVY